MKLALILLCAATCYGQMWPFPGPGRAAAGGGGGGSSVFRGESHVNDDGNLSTVTTPAALSVQNGDLLVVLVGNTHNYAPDSVTCGSDTLTQAQSAYDATGNYRVALYYAEGATAQTTTCTADWGAISVQYRVIVAAAFGGVPTSSALLGGSCNAVSCNALASSSVARTAQGISTATANALLIGAGIDWDGGATHYGVNGYTVRVNPSGVAGSTPFMASRDVSSTGTYPGGAFSCLTASCTGGTPQQYISLFAAFRLQ